jgi:hypothetical protein
VRSCSRLDTQQQCLHAAMLQGSSCCSCSCTAEHCACCLPLPSLQAHPPRLVEARLPPPLAVRGAMGYAQQVRAAGQFSLHD